MRAPLAFLVLCLWMGAAYAVTDYDACAAEHKFPVAADGPPLQYVVPDRLDVAQKQALVACADKMKHLPFSWWVTNVLREDIKAGKVRAPIDLEAERQKKVEKQLDSSWASPQSDLGKLAWKAGAWLAVFMLIVLLWKAGPVILAIGGVLLIGFAVFGATFGAGKGMFDEMGGMYVMFFAAGAVILLVAAGFWALVKRTRETDD